MVTKKKVILTQKQLEAKLEYWQKRLQMRDWNINVCLVKQSAMARDKAAQVTLCPTKMQADVTIVTEDTYTYDLEPYDAEFLLLHELMHVRFADFDNPEVQSETRGVERAINALCYALLELKRGGEELWKH